MKAKYFQSFNKQSIDEIYYGEDIYIHIFVKRVLDTDVLLNFNFRQLSLRIKKPRFVLKMRNGVRVRMEGLEKRMVSEQVRGNETRSSRL